PLIAYALEETLTEAGYDVCGVACTVDEAVALFELHKPELAVLDVHLKEGGRGPDIVQRLGRKSAVGILYTTGDDQGNGTFKPADGGAVMTKPYRLADVVHALAIIREISIAGVATPPFPLGFRLLSDGATRS